MEECIEIDETATAEAPKPPMRQIAELIDRIATERAESAVRLLTQCEHQLSLVRADVGKRDEEIEHLRKELDLRWSVHAAMNTECQSLRDDIDRAVAKCAEAEAARKALREDRNALIEDFDSARRRLTEERDNAVREWRQLDEELTRVTAERDTLLAAQARTPSDTAPADIAELRETVKALCNVVRVILTVPDMRALVYGRIGPKAIHRIEEAAL